MEVLFEDVVSRYIGVQRRSCAFYMLYNTLYLFVVVVDACMHACWVYVNECPRLHQDAVRDPMHALHAVYIQAKRSKCKY
jgi:hypothetical protein